MTEDNGKQNWRLKSKEGIEKASLAIAQHLSG
jgi:hypothetical protein